MDIKALVNHAARMWDEDVLPTLREYIEIPAQSPDFDRDWKEHGYIYHVVHLARNWVREHAPHGTTCEEIEVAGRTPVLFIDMPATGGSQETVLLYSHLDKQPPFEGWRDGLAPWKAVDVHDAQGHRLYGRGGADDGYGVFAAITAIQCLEVQSIPHARCVMIVETGEESGSPDLPFYVEMLKERIGTPSLIVALDSGCGSYDRLWITPSLRGLVSGVLTVEILTEGVHSGDATGIVPDPFRVGYELIQAIEGDGGFIKLKALHAVIPPGVSEQAELAASVLGFDHIARFPWAAGVCPMPTAVGWLASKILARTWEPGLSIVGMEGMPGLGGGNVRLPKLSFKFSIRIPPTVDADIAARAVEAAITRAQQTRLSCHANVTFKVEGHASWLAPKEAPWFTSSVDRASLMVFDAAAVRMGEGGSIPFMGQLGDAFPQAQFLVTGVLGPGSNAHGPNEFLHVDYAMGLTAVVASVIGDHAKHFSTNI